MRFIYSKRKVAVLFANSGDPDQTPRSVASDLGLYYLWSTLLEVSRLQSVMWLILQQLYELSGNKLFKMSKSIFVIYMQFFKL